MKFNLVRQTLCIQSEKSAEDFILKLNIFTINLMKQTKKPLKYRHNISRLILVLMFFCCEVLAQDVARARKNIADLCGAGMNGRGATFQGDSIAAFFIRDRFIDFGLKSFNGDYFQPFAYDINTFPGRVGLRSGKVVLVPGKDFILHPASSGGKQRLKKIFLDTAVFSNPKAAKLFFKRKLSNKAIVLPVSFSARAATLTKAQNFSLYQAGCLISSVDKKLTASLSSHQFECAYFEVKQEEVRRLKKKIDIDVDAMIVKDHLARNVIGFVPGKSGKDSSIVLSAHYDHLGNMGKDTYFPGANDNASGVSLMLELMAFYASPEHQPEYNLVFMAFAAEEAGLIGSKFYTEHPLFPLAKIKFLINLDLMGTGDEGMMVVNGAIHTKAFERLEEINKSHNYLPAIKKRGKAANSDHYFFTEKGVPAFFFYTLGGITAYHDVYDRPETLPLTKYKEVFQLIRDFIDTF